MKRPRILRDAEGGVMVEFSIMMVLFFVLIFGVVEFMLLYWQWNSAAKAVYHGARIASVSDPVAGGLRDYDALEVGLPGDPIPLPGYAITCTATGVASGNCEPGSIGNGLGITFDSDAMQTIVFGRNHDQSCNGETRLHLMGMCHLFRRIGPENVVVTYEHTGLGFVTRPGGPVPTITISLRDIEFEFFFLGGLMNLEPILINTLRTTVTGEDLSRTWGTT
jgi:hypothetical protein